MKEGQIQVQEKGELPEEAEVPLVDDSAFWLGVSQSTLGKIWDYEEDDIYAELLR